MMMIEVEPASHRRGNTRVNEVEECERPGQVSSIAIGKGTHFDIAMQSHASVCVCAREDTPDFDWFHVKSSRK